MNTMVAATVAQEFCMPSHTQDGGLAVAFFNQDHKVEFCIPVETEEEAIGLAVRFQELLVNGLKRYEYLLSGGKVTP